MAGIVTTSSNTGSVRTYKMIFTTTSTSLAINWISGTTSAAPTPFSPIDKAAEVTFQNISTAALNVWLGGSDVAVNNGIFIAQNGTYAAGKTPISAAIQLAEWWACATSTGVTVIAQIVKI